MLVTPLHARLLPVSKSTVLRRLLSLKVSHGILRQTSVHNTKQGKLLSLKHQPSVYVIRSLEQEPYFKQAFVKHGVNPLECILIYRCSHYRQWTILPMMTQLCLVAFVAGFYWQRRDELNLSVADLNFGHPTVHMLLVTLVSLNFILMVTFLRQRIGKLQYIFRHKDRNEYIAVLNNFIFSSKQVKFSLQDCEACESLIKIGNIKIKKGIYHVNSGNFLSMEYYNELMRYQRQSQNEPTSKDTRRKKKK